MKRATLILLTLSITFALALVHATRTAAVQSRRAPKTHEEFDLRLNHFTSLNAPPQTDGPQTEAARTGTAGRESQLTRQRPGARVQWSSLSTTPSRLWNFNGPLSDPHRGDPESLARRFLLDNRDLFRLSDAEVENLRVTRRYRTEHNGLTHVTLGQQFNGIEVFQAEYAIHVAEDGAILAASGELIPDSAARINSPLPRLSAEDALGIAAREVEEELTGPLQLRTQPTGSDRRQEFDRAAGFGDHVPARLAYFPLDADEIRLAWRFILTMRETPDVYFLMIDAERGSLLYLHNLTCYDENPLKPHGLAYIGESPRPNLPLAGTNPAGVQRADLPFRAEPYNGTAIFPVADRHYDWWAGAKADNLASNNTTVYLDRDATANSPDLPRLTAADGNFSFPVDLTKEPTEPDNQKAAQVNLFYWINRYHDILYSFGFNEAAGNFQTNNFGLQGLGNDAVRGEAQDGAGVNNANFATGPDGGLGRVQMFLWTRSTPARDGDFDQGVIIHELTHGLSNRLIGNATGLGGSQGGGMGEGWSDWFGLALLAKESDDLNGEYAVGQYVINNFTRGIRRYPYSTKPGVFPLTYKDIRLSTEVHNVGEIWCNTLWEMRAALIQKYGFKEGQRQAIQLVVDGMKLSPVLPTFVDARNAIIVADRANNNGANQCLLWQVFAKRGLGFRAETLGVSDGAPLESLDTAFYCSDAGILSLDKSNYVPGELVKLTLGDRNATGAVAVQVSSSVTGDQETLTLERDGPITGSYLGALRIAAGPAKANDGILQGSAERLDEITATYNDPNNGAGVPATIKTAAAMTREKVTFEDMVETGNQGWIATGSWGIVTTRAASGARSWTDSPAGNYANSVNQSLTSQLFDFTNLNEVTLSFAQSLDTESKFDFGVVEYSTDDGATWTRGAAYSGRQLPFTQARVPLRALDGQQRARIRFRFFSDAGVVGDGWYLDDIRLTARTNNGAIIPPGSTPAPVISGVLPAFGAPAGGTAVTIYGTGFTEDDTTAVTFDGLPARSFSVMGSGAITAVTPPHAAGPVTVRVLNRNGAAGFQGGFTYYTPGGPAVAPSISALFPNSGATRGGTSVTVLGANFTPETIVSFGATRAASTTFINARTLRAVTPAGGLGAVEVAAANGALRDAMPNGFSYTAASPPSVQLLSLTGGQTVWARSTVNINWRSSDNRAITRHRIVLVRGTTVTDIATNLPGSDQSFAWVVPTGLPSPTAARIRVIAADDEGTESDALSSSDITIAQRWEAQALLPVALQRLQVASDGKVLYSFGGRTTTSSASTVATGYKFDPAAAQPAWVTTGVAPMPAGLNGGEAVFLGGRIYIPGGFNVQAVQSTQHFAYDVAANSWTTLNSPPVGAILYALAADEARNVYYFSGGLPASGPSARVSGYDPLAKFWNDLPAMNTARYGHEAAMIEGKLYVTGGIGASGGLASGEVYDFATGQWTPIAPLNRPRAYAVNVVSKDAGGNPIWIVTGGQDTNTGAFLGTEIYDVGNNRWIVLDNSFAMNAPRALLNGAVAGDHYYAVAGSTTAIVRNVERTRISSLTLVPANQAPVLAVPAAQTAVAGVELRFTVTANDLGSGAPVQLTAAGLPPAATFTTEAAGNNSTRGTLRWTPTPADAGLTFTATFTASDGQLSDAKAVLIRALAPGSLAAVNAADFRAGVLAPDSISSLFGSNLAVRAEVARELPLPYELADTRVTVNGIAAPLFFVSPAQINFAVPPGLDPGAATVVVSNNLSGSVAAGIVQIAPSMPGIFTLNSTGRGDAAALATVDGVTFQAQPFDVRIGGQANVLLLFGTGIRRAPAANPNDANGVAEAVTATIGGQTARVLFAGPQGAFTGLDQLNIEFPAGLAGGAQRRVEVVVSVNGIPANRVTILIR